MAMLLVMVFYVCGHSCHFPFLPLIHSLPNSQTFIHHLLLDHQHLEGGLEINKQINHWPHNHREKQSIMQWLFQLKMVQEEPA
jgi:hypothetical protein